MLCSTSISTQISDIDPEDRSHCSVFRAWDIARGMPIENTAKYAESADRPEARFAFSPKPAALNEAHFGSESLDQERRVSREELEIRDSGLGLRD
jgi:hypothetical protein